MKVKKRMSNRKFKAIWFSIFALVIALLLTVNILARDQFYVWLTVFLEGEMPYKLTQVEDMSNIDTEYFKSEFASKEAAFANGLAVAEEIVAESTVLLKNENNALPLAAGSNISVFGNGARDVVYGGAGSGEVVGLQAHDITHVLSEIAGYNVNPTLKTFYEGRREARGVLDMYRPTFHIGEVSPFAIPRARTMEYDAYGDAAVIVFGRPGGEDHDMQLDMASHRGLRGEHQLQLDEDERDLLEYVKEYFDRIIVIVNSGQPIEAGIIQNDPDVDAVLWMGLPGMGIDALSKIMTGEISPSGRTADIWAQDFRQDPTFANFGSFAYDSSLNGYHFVDYAEGIYMGYRYYETRFQDDEPYYQSVTYPFGYGLSYTTFDWALKESTTGKIGEDDVITVTVTVTNTGDVAGKDVVQLYYTPPYTPGGIEKPHVVLGAFAKTDTLNPGQSQDIELTMPARQMASYDYNDANNNGFRGWELESGDYLVRLMLNSHTMSSIEPITLNVNSDIKYATDEVTGTEIVNLFDDVSNGVATYLSRNDWEGTWPAAPEGRRTADATLQAAVIWTPENDPNDEMPVTGAVNHLVLADLLDRDYDDPLWEDLLDQITIAEMRQIIEYSGFQTMMAQSVQKPPTLDVDGPSVLNPPMSFMGTTSAIDFGGRTAYPSPSTLTASWNVDMAYKMGNAIGNEALHLGVSGWYAPGLNIHRSPFGGRVFEYYSEDGYLAGMIAANVVEAVQGKGVTPYMKHFAVNEQETNRSKYLLTWASEQSMREIYFKPFELAVKQGGSRGIMSAFNFIGPTWAGGHSGLLQDLLRDEWGFRGTVISDFATPPFVRADHGIRAGNDIMLSPDGTLLSDTTSATSVLAMRRAVKNVLYTTVNSNAMNGLSSTTQVEYLTPRWVPILNAVTAVMGAIILVGIFLVLRRAKKFEQA